LAVNDPVAAPLPMSTLPFIVFSLSTVPCLPDEVRPFFTTVENPGGSERRAESIDLRLLLRQ
jgi:hypothetical protein